MRQSEQSKLVSAAHNFGKNMVSKPYKLYHKFWP